MTRRVIVSVKVEDRLDDLVACLQNELKFSEEAASAYRARLIAFIARLGIEVDYALCRFKRWRELGYHCAVFERGWVLAYEIVPGGVIVRDMCHGKLLAE